MSNNEEIINNKSAAVSLAALLGVTKSTQSKPFTEPSSSSYHISPNAKWSHIVKDPLTATVSQEHPPSLSPKDQIPPRSHPSGPTLEEAGEELLKRSSENSAEQIRPNIFGPDRISPIALKLMKQVPPPFPSKPKQPENDNHTSTDSVPTTAEDLRPIKQDNQDPIPPPRSLNSAPRTPFPSSRRRFSKSFDRPKCRPSQVLENDNTAFNWRQQTFSTLR